MKEKTNLIFIHRLIKSLADSLITIFAPLLILKKTDNLNLTMIYLVCYYFLCGSLNYVLRRFLQKYGTIAIILHIVPLIVLQFLFTLNITLPLIFVIALVVSLAQVLYSVPINLVLTFSDKKANIAKFDIPTNIGKCAFILFSGYVIGSEFKNSILILSIIGTTLYLISVIPILFSYKMLKEKYALLHNVKPQIDKKDYRRLNILNILFGLFQTVIDVCVPLFLYINNINYTAITVVVAFIEILKLLSNLFAKFLLSKNKGFLATVISSGLMLVGVILILTIKNDIALYICSCVISVGFPLMHVSVSGEYFRRINKDNNQLNGMTNRDILILSSRCILYAPYFICSSMILSFAIGLLSAILIPFFSYDVFNKKNNG